MTKKFDRILRFSTVVLPFVISAIGFVNSVQTKDASHFREACMWVVIGTIEGQLYLKEKKNGTVH